LFGDEQVMPLKVIWDYTFYWALLAPVFFAGRITDVAMYGRLRPLFERGAALNAAMQPLLREWGRRNAGRPAARGRQLDQYRIGGVHEMNRALADRLDDAGFDARISGNLRRMEALGAELLAQARCIHPGIDDHGLDALLAGAAHVAGMPSLDAAWYAAARGGHGSPPAPPHPPPPAGRDPGHRARLRPAAALRRPAAGDRGDGGRTGARSDRVRGVVPRRARGGVRPRVAAGAGLAGGARAGALHVHRRRRAARARRRA